MEYETTAVASEAVVEHSVTEEWRGMRRGMVRRTRVTYNEQVEEKNIVNTVISR